MASVPGPPRCPGPRGAACPIPAEPASSPAWLARGLGLREAGGWVNGCLAPHKEKAFGPDLCLFAEIDGLSRSTAGLERPVSVEWSSILSPGTSCFAGTGPHRWGPDTHHRVVGQAQHPVPGTTGGDWPDVTVRLASPRVPAGVQSQAPGPAHPGRPPRLRGGLENGAGQPAQGRWPLGDRSRTIRTVCRM